ncbi:MAG: DegT/DnrJ/EryC1/StrS family aminotransferase [Dysgonamonadaceae bacterium]|jgi:dTDP-4-amino-4,6-dideoxygalactose transaminase|nr:DegT/DnrJ/EryC1/StrS family aminotransferase [Dysgonamonadaceae bacterium]
MTPLQMVDLTTQYKHLRKEIEKAVQDVLRSGKYINGAAVDALAAGLSEYLDVKYVIPCANGTDALQIALMALDLQQEDEIIVPAFTYAATAEAIALLKLTPVLVDVDPLTFNIDVKKVEEVVTPRTRAIVPVHLFGQTADMEPLMQIARKYGLSVIEDNAQSIGSTYTFQDGTKKQAGTIGTIGTLSFFPTKNLGAYGDGGALLTGDEDLAKKIKMIARHGQSQKYMHERIGCNSRLDTLQAAILNVKLPYLNTYNQIRIRTAEEYNAQLKPLSHLLDVPHCAAQSTHVYHQYTVKIKQDRDKVQKHLQEKGVPTMIYYPLPLHHQPAFKYILKKGSNLNESENLCRSVLSLPMHTELDKEQIQYIIDQLRSYE